MNITEFRKLKRRQYQASWQWAKRRKMISQRKGSCISLDETDSVDLANQVAASPSNNSQSKIAITGTAMV